MQKIITKYGLAAHLALLAVAPLILSPSFVLWLSLIGLVWLLMQPSQIGREYLHSARRRVAKAIVGDPFFWFLLGVVVYAAIRCANGGLGLSYDAEKAVWSLSTAACPILPAAADGCGFNEFAASVAMVVVVQGCRHALGKNARGGFLYASSLISGAIAVIIAVSFACGSDWASRMVDITLAHPQFLGAIFAAYLIAGTVALAFVIENAWYRAMPMMFFSIGGNLLGLFIFALPGTQIVFVAAWMIIFLYVFSFLLKNVPGASELKLIMMTVVSFGAAALVAVAVLPEKIMTERIDPWVELAFVPEGFWEMRNALSNVSLKTWLDNSWLGTGLGTLVHDIKFYATESDWQVLWQNHSMALNGYWQLLAERGIIGAAVFAVALIFICWTYFRRLVHGILAQFPHPACWLGPIVVIAFAVEGYAFCSFLHPAALIVIVSCMAISANSFPKEK